MIQTTLVFRKICFNS